MICLNTLRSFRQPVFISLMNFAAHHCFAHFLEVKQGCPVGESIGCNSNHQVWSHGKDPTSVALLLGSSRWVVQATLLSLSVTRKKNTNLFKRGQKKPWPTKWWVRDLKWSNWLGSTSPTQICCSQACDTASSGWDSRLLLRSALYSYNNLTWTSVTIFVSQ